MLTEAPLLCAREERKGIFTNCADTARLVGRSRCCKSPISQRSVQSSLADLCVPHEVCLWNMSVQDDSAHSCDPPDVIEATAFPSEEDDAIREWKQKFPEQTRHAISRIHANLGQSRKSALAKMISGAGGSEGMIICATRYPCANGCLGLGSGFLCQFQGLDSSTILCWLVCISGITSAVSAGVLAD